MAVSLAQFVENLTASGLMSADEVVALRAKHPSDDAQSFAQELIRSGRLTKYQTAAVYQGKTRGLVLGEYVVLDKLGEGGMGVVLKAQHRRMKRLVAVKILPAAQLKSPEAVKRFYHEVEAAARLSHPNIVTAHDAGECQGIHYLAMEFVDGQDLASLVNRHGPLPVAQAVDCILQAARGLQYAHGKGVIHRDIKPANLLLDREGTLKILDMGLAHITTAGGDEATGDERLTQSGQVMGTCDYMAPEQAENTRRADHRADIYSLGCTLYRLLTSRPPFTGETAIQVLMAHIQQPIPSLSSARADVSAKLEAVFQRMLAKRLEDRYQSMGEVVEALEAVRSADGPSGDEPSSDQAIKSFFQSLEASRKTTPVGRHTSLASATAQAPPALVPQETLTHQIEYPTTTDFGRKRLLQRLHNRRLLIPLGCTAVMLIAVILGLVLRGDKAKEFPVAEKSGKMSVSQKATAEDARWKPGPAEDVWPGLVPRPAVLPGVKRWQVEAVMPRSAFGEKGLCYSPDGRLLACSADRAIRIYRTDDWQLQQIFFHDACRIAFSPKGRWLASAGQSEDKTIHLWDIAAGRAGPVLKGHTTDIISIAWSPDGTQLLSGGGWGDGTLRLWSREGACLRTWESGLGRVSSVAWSPDGRLLACGGAGNQSGKASLRIWTTHAEPGPSLEVAGESQTRCVAWSPDGRHFAAATGSSLTPGTVFLWETSSWKRIKTFEKISRTVDLRWSPDSKRVALVGQGQEAYVVSLDDTVPQKMALWNPGANYTCLAWHPKRQQIAVGSDFGVMECWDVAQGRHGSFLGDCCTSSIDAVPSPDRKWLAVFNRDGAEIRICSSERRPVERLTSGNIGILSVAWNADSTRLAYGLRDGTIRFWSREENDSKPGLNTHSGPVLSLAWSPRGNLLVSGGEDRVVRLWQMDRLASANLVQRHSGSIAQVLWSPDGSQFASRSGAPGDTKVCLWKADGTAGATIDGPKEGVWGIAWSPDSTRLAVSGKGGTVFFHSPTDGSLAGRIATPFPEIFSSQWSPDGKWLAVAGKDPKGGGNLIGFWKPDGTRGPQHHAAPGAGMIQWSPNSRLLIRSSGQSQECGVLSPTETSMVSKLSGHDSFCHGVCWDSDSRQVLTVSWDRTLRRWDAQTGEQLSTTLFLPKGESAYFTTGGRLETTSREAEKHLVYVVEQADGEIRPFTPTEFAQKYGWKNDPAKAQAGLRP
jgi:WD40 repeat protein/serine/threonine protein kinase